MRGMVVLWHGGGNISKRAKGRKEGVGRVRPRKRTLLLSLCWGESQRKGVGQKHLKREREKLEDKRRMTIGDRRKSSRATHTGAGCRRGT